MHEYTVKWTHQFKSTGDGAVLSLSKHWRHLAVDGTVMTTKTGQPVLMSQAISREKN